MQKRAFTLTELLIALGVVGAIAAVSIPSLMSTINNRVLASQLKNTVVGIQQVIDEQLTRNHTSSLSDTDFHSADTLLSDTNFSTSKQCKADKSTSDCWKTTGQTPASKNIQYKKLNGQDYGMLFAAPAVIIKNGAVISYLKAESAPFQYEGITDKLIGFIQVDINGSEGPNIVGRDFFSFYVTDKGKIVDRYYDQDNVTLTTKQADCSSGSPFACFGAVVDDGWRIRY